MNPEIRERIELVRRGEVPEGYKQKEHRLFPKGWHYDKLGKHLLEYDELSSETNFYPIATSSRQGLMLQTEYYNDQRYEDTTGGFHVVPEGYVTYRHMSDDDIFHLNINELGQSVLVSPEYPVFTTTPDMVQALVVNYINEMEVFRTFSAAQKKGSTRTRMYFHRLCEFSLPIPPLQEQQKIAEILACCEKAIALKKQFIAEKRRQKASLMQKLLDPNSGVRLPGFEESKWSETPLANLCSFVGGGTPDTKNVGYWDGTVPWISSADLQENSNSVSITRFISEKAIRNSATQLCPKGTILIVTRVGVGKIAVAPEPLCTSQDFTNLVNVKGNIVFLLHVLSIAIGKILALSQGTSIQGISSREIKAIQLKVPTIEEQTAIANILSAADCEIDLLEQELEAWQQKRKALMQLLLTGLVRV